jgi:hypothetical protein
MIPAERIAACAYRHWIKAGMTEWPEVRVVARRLRVSQRLIDQCSGDGPYLLQGYNVEDWKLGDLEVCAMTEQVDEAWAKYWAAYNMGPR